MLTGPSGSEYERMMSEEGEDCTSCSRKILDVRRQGGETEHVNDRVADSRAGGFTPEFSKPRLVGFVPVLPVGPVVVDRGQEVLSLLECSLGCKKRSSFGHGDYYSRQDGNVEGLFGAYQT